MFNKYSKIHLTLSALSGLALIWALQTAEWSFVRLWLTPEQHFHRHFSKGEFKEAARAATDPMRRGAAQYMDGKFKEAASSFGSRTTPEALYNRGNSLLMQGLYGAAINSYEQALSKKPDWQKAIDNLNLALLRKEMLAPPEDDYGGTGGMLAADEFVIGERKVPDSAAQTATEENKQLISEDEQRALWLRKVQTEPKDFLRIKFSYQLNMNQQDQN